MTASPHLWPPGDPAPSSSAWDALITRAAERLTADRALGLVLDLREVVKRDGRGAAKRLLDTCETSLTKVGVVRIAVVVNDPKPWKRPRSAVAFFTEVGLAEAWARLPRRWHAETGALRNEQRQPTVRDDVIDAASVEALRRPLLRAPANIGGLMWVPMPRFDAAAAGNTEPVRELGAYFGESFARAFYAYADKLLDFLPTQHHAALAGAEVWHLNKTAGADVGVHMDWTTHMPPSESVRPLWSTILYLGPADPDDVEGGRTGVVEGEPDPDALSACFTSLDAEQLLRLPCRWHAVTPKAGRCVVFAGDTPHFVERVRRITAGRVRTTLLINFWTFRPKEFEGFGDGLSWVKPEDVQLLMRLRPTELMRAALAAFLSVRKKRWPIAMGARAYLWLRSVIARASPLGGPEGLRDFSAADRQRLAAFLEVAVPFLLNPRVGTPRY